MNYKYALNNSNFRMYHDSYVSYLKYLGMVELLESTPVHKDSVNYTRFLIDNANMGYYQGISYRMSAILTIVSLIETIRENHISAAEEIIH